MKDLEYLNATFGIPGVAQFEKGKGGLTQLAVSTAAAEARLYTQGAHLTHWQPQGLKPVLFMSDKSWFESGKPIRGGVPVCFPWFGSKQGDPDAPNHGFVRIMEWEVMSLSQEADGSVHAELGISTCDETRRWCPADFRSRLAFSIGRSLSMALTTVNTGGESFVFTEALHTYFEVDDVHSILIRGLEGAEYINTIGTPRLERQDDRPIRIEAEIDRTYLHNASTCVVEIPGRKRTIRIEKRGSRTTQVWNPWIAKSAAMPDFGDDEWVRMICVETANADDDAVRLAPGETHTVEARLSLS